MRTTNGANEFVSQHPPKPECDTHCGIKVPFVFAVAVRTSRYYRLLTATLIARRSRRHGHSTRQQPEHGVDEAVPGDDAPPCGSQAQPPAGGLGLTINGDHSIQTPGLMSNGSPRVIPPT